MKEKVDQDSEGVDGSRESPPSERASRSTDRVSRLALTRARWWLTVKRRAPAHLASRIFCSTFGSRANWKVTARGSTSPVCETMGQSDVKSLRPVLVVSVTRRGAILDE